MTRVADLHYPGSIPKDDDQFNFTVDYLCFVGITEPTPGDSITRVLQPGEPCGFSYPGVYFMLSLNDDTTVNWFALVECPNTYTYPRIPRWSEEEVKAKLEEIADYDVCSPMKFRDIWKITPQVSTVPAHEGILTTWSSGRIACIGDSVFKVTPNLAQGANLCIESAAALANALNHLNTSNADKKPTKADIHTAISQHLLPLQRRITGACNEPYRVSRMQSLRTRQDWFMARHVQPRLLWLMFYLIYVLMEHAVVLSYLPFPKRARMAQERRTRAIQAWAVRSSCGILLGAAAVASLFWKDSVLEWT